MLSAVAIRRSCVVVVLSCIVLSASARAQSREQLQWANDFIGPVSTRADGSSDAAGAKYWTDVVGVPFTRDAAIDIPPTPIDLNLDGRTDLTFSRHVELPGGILRNPRLAGLAPTPRDPAGTVGKYSVSTGFLGVREELDPRTGRGTGRFAFNCLLCHGGVDAGGHITIDRPNTNIYLGLIMASARVMDAREAIRELPAGAPIAPDGLRVREGLDAMFDLDPNHDGSVTIAEWRAALRMAPAGVAQAQLLLAGPGRLDQSIDHRMDGNIPLANLQHRDYAAQGPARYLSAKRAPKISIFNPVSLPVIHVGTGVAEYSWNGRDSSFRHDVAAAWPLKMALPADELAKRLDLPDWSADGEAVNRALTLDFRNVSTYGLETDDMSGATWPERMITAPAAALLADTPEKFGARRLRALIAAPGPAAGELSAEAAEGRRVFFEEPCGEIVNQRVTLGRDAAIPDAFATIAVLLPIDRSRAMNDRVPVRCATCHHYSPTVAPEPLSTTIDIEHRCDVCHLDHPDEQREGEFIPLAEQMRREGVESGDGCRECHDQHPAFGRQAYSNSWLLPFDADSNGVTFGDEPADAAAGGIGTDALLNADTNFSVQLRPAAQRPRKLYLVLRHRRETPPEPRFSSKGLGWVRVAPLIGAGGSAPYLHNGSVPTLEALLAPPAERPRRFPVGLPEQDFNYDTTLPGNGNGGHSYGSAFTPAQKKALAAFVRTL